MKDSLKRFVIRYPLLEWLMFHFYRIKGKNVASTISEKRKDASLFDIKTLAADIPFAPVERVIDNNLYGYVHQIKNFAGTKKDLRGYIEHGLFWGGMVHQDEKNWHYKRIYTLSNRRKEDIAKKISGKDIVTFGPYIHYATPLFTEEARKKLKKELGKVLLVFPSHSVKNVDAVFDLEQFIAEINLRKKGFDTVLISMYFIDAQNEKLVAAYKKEGFKIVTSGHKFDNYFVARQRTIIELADMTMSNEVGTHVGYCIYLQKPHYIFSQKIDKVAISAHEQMRIDTVSEPNDFKRELAQKESFKALFGKYEELISEAQHAKCADFWGFDCIKSVEKLQQLIG